MHVIKVVEFVTRIPEKLDFYFYDFSTNFYAFSNFAALSSSVFYRLVPGGFGSSQTRSLAGIQSRGGKGVPIFAELPRRRRGLGGGGAQGG